MASLHDHVTAGIYGNDESVGPDNPRQRPTRRRIS